MEQLIYHSCSLSKIHVGGESNLLTYKSKFCEKVYVSKLFNLPDFLSLIYDNCFLLLTGSIISGILFFTTGTRNQSGLGEELRKYDLYICYIHKYMLVNRIRYRDRVCIASSTYVLFDHRELIIGPSVSAYTPACLSVYFLTIILLA